jgi:hypothetical protein
MYNQPFILVAAAAAANPRIACQWLQSGQKVVTRPPQYDDDSQLPMHFFQKTGA